MERTNSVRIHSCEISKVVEIIKTESRKVVSKGWRREEGESVFSEHRVSVLQEEKVLSGDFTSYNALQSLVLVL